MSVRRRMRGAALIAAVLLAAVVAAIAVALSTRDQFSILGASRLRDMATVDDLTGALEVKAARALSADLEASRHDGLAEDWRAARFESAKANWTAEARLQDAQRLFNLNSLTFQPPERASAAAGGGDGPPPEDPNLAPQANETVGNDAGPRADASRSPQVAGQATPGVSGSPGAAGARGIEACGDSGTCLRSTTGAMPGAAQPNAARNEAAASRALARIAGAAATPGSAVGGPTAEGAAPTVPDGNGTGEAGSPAAGDGDALSPQQVAIARFQLLCEALDLPPAIVPAILDWVDADSETRFPNGAEDDYYTRLERPYRAANGPFGDVSELRLVRGVTDEIHARLAPFITVIGRATAINVNTAPAEILMSLGPGIDRGTAEILIGSREIQPFTSVEMLLQNPVLLGRPLLATGLSTSSSYFELRTRAVGDDLPYFRRSLLERTAPTRLRVVRREVLYSDG